MTTPDPDSTHPTRDQRCTKHFQWRRTQPPGLPPAPHLDCDTPIPYLPTNRHPPPLEPRPAGQARRQRPTGHHPRPGEIELCVGEVEFGQQTGPAPEHLRSPRLEPAAPAAQHRFDPGAEGESAPGRHTDSSAPRHGPRDPGPRDRIESDRKIRRTRGERDGVDSDEPGHGGYTPNPPVAAQGCENHDAANQLADAPAGGSVSAPDDPPAATRDPAVSPPNPRRSLPLRPRHRDTCDAPDHFPCRKPRPDRESGP